MIAPRARVGRYSAIRQAVSRTGSCLTWSSPLTLLLCLMMFQACSSVTTQPRVEQGDSAGIRVSTIHGDTTDLPWLALGEATGDLLVPDTSGLPGFSSVVAGFLLSEGGVAIVDATERGVMFFDGQGAFLGLVGRQGQGPGEFLLPTSASRLRGDTLAVFDRRSRRVTFLSIAADQPRTLPVDGDFRPLDAWVSGSGSSVFVSYTAGASQSRTVSGDAVVNSLTFCLALFSSSAQPYCFPGAEELVSGVHHLPVPFGSRPWAYPLDTGLLFSTGNRFELVWFGKDLTPSHILRWPGMDRAGTLRTSGWLGRHRG